MRVGSRWVTCTRRWGTCTRVGRIRIDIQPVSLATIILILCSTVTSVTTPALLTDYKQMQCNRRDLDHCHKQTRCNRRGLDRNHTVYNLESAEFETKHTHATHTHTHTHTLHLLRLRRLRASESLSLLRSLSRSRSLRAHAYEFHCTQQKITPMFQGHLVRQGLHMDAAFTDGDVLCVITYGDVCCLISSMN